MPWHKRELFNNPGARLTSMPALNLLAQRPADVDVAHVYLFLIIALMHENKC